MGQLRNVLLELIFELASSNFSNIGEHFTIKLSFYSYSIKIVMRCITLLIGIFGTAIAASVHQQVHGGTIHKISARYEEPCLTKKTPNAEAGYRENGKEFGAASNDDTNTNKATSVEQPTQATESGTQNTKMATETDYFKVAPPGTTVSSLQGAEASSSGNTSVSVVADKDSGASAANTEEGGATISAAEQGASLGLAVSRIYNNPVHYTDGNGVEYYQSEDGTWYYYPSPLPNKKSDEPGSSVTTKEGAKVNATGTTSISVGADKESGAASGNADKDGSVISIAQIGAAIGGAVSN